MAEKNIPDEQEYKVYFRPEGGIARVVSYPEYLDNPPRMKFLLRPTPAYEKILGQKVMTDKGYDEKNHLWVKEIRMEHITPPTLMNMFPTFLTWEVSVNWKGEYIDLDNSEINFLRKRVMALKDERDALNETLKSLGRNMGMLSKHSTAFHDSIFMDQAKKVNTINPVLLSAQGQPKGV